MIDADFAQRFAREWVQAWNDHDLDAILAHYAEDITFHSPRVRLVMGGDIDAVRGKDGLRQYWALALEKARDLYFEIDRVFLGSDALTIIYTNHRQQTVSETFIFARDGKVTTSCACYA